MEPGVPPGGPLGGRDAVARTGSWPGVRDAEGAEALAGRSMLSCWRKANLLLVTDLATAWLARRAANAFLVTKISFINAMAEVCEAADADVGLPG